MKNVYWLAALLLSTTVLSCSAIKQKENTLDATTFSDKIKKTLNAVVIDVRTPEEFEKGFIEKAKNIDFNASSFETEINKLDKTKTYFVYCLSGGRSGAAANFMRASGFKNVFELKGGILAWQQSNLPLITNTKEEIPDKITMAEFKKITRSAPIVLIDFYAPWCAPCKKMKPMFDSVATEYRSKVEVVRINIDENKKLAKQLDVMELPVIKIYTKGEETFTHHGLIGKAELVKRFHIK